MHSMIRTDVLVVGGGAAGVLAALTAKKNVAGVVLVSKGSDGRSGNTPHGGRRYTGVLSCK